MRDRQVAQRLYLNDPEFNRMVNTLRTWLEHGISAQWIRAAVDMAIEWHAEDSEIKAMLDACDRD